MTQTVPRSAPRRAPQQRLAAVRAALVATAPVSPRLAGRLALELWRRPGRPVPVRSAERGLHEAARTAYVEHRGPVATYAWGDGARPVLLVHGWGARASRFATVVGALLQHGYSPVSYDAWGHGATPGPAGTILDHQVVIGALAERHGTFDGVVAHSLGVPIALYAVREGLAVERIVGISGMGEFGYVVDSFCAGLGLPAPVGAELRRAIERAYFAGDAGIWERFSAGPMPGRDLLVVHDDSDRVVDPRQADRVLYRVGGGATALRTSGLGHARILDDPEVVSAVVAFLSRRTS
jgi:hypothetical protein